MRNIFFCIAFLIFTPKLKAQLDKAQFTTHFAFQVLTVDDFFERFNFRKSTAFQKFMEKQYPGIVLSRKDLVTSLFNLQNKNITPEKKEKFILSVTDSLHPLFLKYGDSNWYAKLLCKVIYQGKARTLTLILKVENSGKNAFKWAVVSAKAEFLNSRLDSLLWLKKNAERSSAIPNQSNKYFLSPVSHGIDFTNVDNLFINKQFCFEYLAKGPISIELYNLLGLIQESKIKFGHVQDVSYHLLQLDGWIVVLDNFNRSDLNSGWLMNQLVKADKEDKESYKIKNLNIVKH